MLMATALVTSLVAAAEEARAPVFAPPAVIALIAAVVFFVLGIIVFSYKNVANRQKARAAAHHDAPVDEFGHAETH